MPNLKSIQWEKLLSPQEMLDKKIKEEKENNSDEDSTYISTIITPHGIVPAKSVIPLDCDYNLFVGHTNFYITEPICFTMNKISGVELFNVLSPYRMVVGIAKNISFDIKDVKLNIAKLLNAVSIEKDE